MLNIPFYIISEITVLSVCVFSAFIYLIKFFYNRSSKDSLMFAVIFLCAAMKVLAAGADTASLHSHIEVNLVSVSDRLLTSVILLLIQIVIRMRPGNPYKIQIHNFYIRNHAFLTDILFAVMLVFIPRSYNPIPTAFFAVLFLLRGISSVILRFKNRKDEPILYLSITVLIIGLSAALFVDAVTSFNDLYIVCFVILLFAFMRIYVTAKKSGLSHQLETRLNERIQVAENAFMNAQMKPHFIYNALNTIADRCTADPKDAERLILSLSKYMRQTLSYDSLSGITPLKKEIELVKAYADIECKRFDNIDVYYILPEELPELSLPPLTIQPLVENAIKHGLRKKHGGGYVAVTVKKTQNDMYLVSVEDNGVGINDDAKLSMLNLPKGSDSIGLYNINQRLISLYGNGLTIDNPEDGGTRVFFELPSYKH